MKKFFCLFILLAPVFAHAGNIIVMRHGEAENNVLGVFNTNPKNPGYIPMHLTDKGRKQVKYSAICLNEFLNKNDLHIHKIFSSPLPRAFETATIVNSRLDEHVSIKEDARIIENDMGSFEGTHYNDYPYDHGDFSHNHDLEVPGEILEEVEARLKDFLENEIQPLLEEDKTALVVSHGTPSYMLLKLLGQTQGIALGNAKFYFVPDVKF